MDNNVDVGYSFKLLFDAIGLVFWGFFFLYLRLRKKYHFFFYFGVACIAGGLLNLSMHISYPANLLIMIILLILAFILGGREINVLDKSGLSVRDILRPDKLDMLVLIVFLIVWGIVKYTIMNLSTNIFTTARGENTISWQHMARTFTSIAIIIYGLGFLTIGLILQFNKNPLILSGRLCAAAITITLCPFYALAIARGHSDPASLSLVLLIISLPIMLAISVIGDFMFFNVPETLLRSKIESILRRHNIIFEQGETTGLFSTGHSPGQTRSRSIVTLNLPYIGASVRYAMSKESMCGFFHLIKKAAIPNCAALLAELKGELLAESVDPGPLPQRFLLVGGAIISIALFRLYV